MTDLEKARGAYRMQVKHCLSRRDRTGLQIEMRLTFEQWLQIWLDSGKFELRGRNKGCYQMGRNNDLGHYEVGNVSIVSIADNARNTLTPSRIANVPTMVLLASSKEARAKAVVSIRNTKVRKLAELGYPRPELSVRHPLNAVYHAVIKSGSYKSRTSSDLG